MIVVKTTTLHLAINDRGSNQTGGVFMRQLSSTRNFLAIIVMALLLAVASPATSFGQDRNGRGRDRDNQDWSKRNRKCGKFVNCHDARNGRWDRRGARGDRVGNVIVRDRFRQRVRNRNFNDDFGSRRLGNRNFDNTHVWRQRRVRNN